MGIKFSSFPIIFDRTGGNMVLNRDDPLLVAYPDMNLDRPRLMRWWYALNRDDSDRWVNLPLYRLIVTTDVDWPKEETN